MRRRGDDVAVLAAWPPFDRCRRRSLAPLGAHVNRMPVAEGSVVACKGWTVREVIVVLAGSVVATEADGSTRRFGPGELIGAAELLCGAAHPATLVAGPDLEVLVIYGPAYRWAARTVLSPVVDDVDYGLG